VPGCKNVQEASDICQADSAFLGAPEDCSDQVWFAYMGNQVNMHVAKSDVAQEGQWRRAYGK